MSWLGDVLAAIGGFFGGVNDTINHLLFWLLDTVRHVDPVVRTLIAGVGMFCETSILIGLIVPGDTIVIVASTGVASPVEYVALLVAVVAGSLAGESVGFALGRWFGHGIRHSRLGRRIGEKLARRQGLAKRLLRPGRKIALHDLVGAERLVAIAEHRAERRIAAAAGALDRAYRSGILCHAATDRPERRPRNRTRGIVVIGAAA